MGFLFVKVRLCNPVWQNTVSCSRFLFFCWGGGGGEVSPSNPFSWTICTLWCNLKHRATCIKSTLTICKPRGELVQKPCCNADGNLWVKSTIQGEWICNDVCEYIAEVCVSVASSAIMGNHYISVSGWCLSMQLDPAEVEVCSQTNEKSDDAHVDAKVSKCAVKPMKTQTKHMQMCRRGFDQPPDVAAAE